MSNRREATAATKRELAQNVPEDVIETIRQHHPAAAHELTRAVSLHKTSKAPLGDDIPIDMGVLAAYRYKGESLTAGEIEFIVRFVGNRFETRAINGKETEMNRIYLSSQKVLEAIHEITKDFITQFNISPQAVIRQLSYVLDSNITDVCDITKDGVVLKDFSTLPRHVTASVMEVHEIRNAQGTQIRVRHYDKIAAITALSRILGLNKDKVEITNKVELSDALERALSRINDPEIIEGTVIQGQLTHE